MLALLIAIASAQDDEARPWPQPATVRAVGWFASAEENRGFGGGVEGEGWLDNSFGLGGRIGRDTMGESPADRGRTLIEVQGLVGLGDLDRDPVGVRGVLGLGLGLAPVQVGTAFQCTEELCEEERRLTSNLAVSGGALLTLGPLAGSATVRFEYLNGDHRGAGALVTAGFGLGANFGGTIRPRSPREPRPDRGPAATGWAMTPDDGLSPEGYPMVVVQPGTFTMGPIDGRREVTVSQPFAIGTTEVPQRIYKEVVGRNPSYFPGGWRPVERVTWFDAVLFCNAWSEQAGLTPAYTVKKVYDTLIVRRVDGANGFRLPTEAEWEHAARAGHADAAWAGADHPDHVAWYLGTSGDRTHKVGTRVPTALGLADLSGNVAEWVWDREGELPAAGAVDPRGAVDGDKRVVRGGSWRSPPDGARVDARRGVNAWQRGPDVGFRVVRSLTAEEARDAAVEGG